MSKNAESFDITQNFALGFQEAHLLAVQSSGCPSFQGFCWSHTSSPSFAGNLQQECQCPQGLEAK